MIGWLFHSALGPHIWDIPLDRYHDEESRIVKLLETTSTLYSLTLLFTKLSILLLFLRLFRVMRRARIWIYIGIILTLATHITGAVLSLTAAAPSEEDPSDFHSVGVKNLIGISITALNFVGDIYILVLPLFEVSRLQLYRVQKVRVLAVFSTGFLSVINSE